MTFMYHKSMANPLHCKSNFAYGAEIQCISHPAYLSKYVSIVLKSIFFCQELLLVYIAVRLHCALTDLLLQEEK